MLYYGGIIHMIFTNLYSYSTKTVVGSLIVTESVKSRNYNVLFLIHYSKDLIKLDLTDQIQVAPRAEER